jgi:HEAT repeat protein
MTVARSLWKIDQETNGTSKSLQYVIDHSTNTATRAGALAFLSDIHPGDESLIEPLIGMLSDASNENESAIVTRVGHYGPKAKAAVPLLILLLNATNVELRTAALQSLKNIDPETAAKYEEK